MKNLFLLITLLFPFISKAEFCHSMNSVSWLLGDWQNKNNERKITESWHQVSPETLEGKGVTYDNGQVKSSESLRIVEMSEDLYYIAKVKYNSLPVAFKLTSCSNNKLIFENHSHDFPKRIEYAFVDKGNIKVIVSDGKAKEFSIDFIQKKQINTPRCVTHNRASNGY